MTDGPPAKSKPLARRDHFVPQSYLKRFAAEDVLWVLDFHKRCHHPSTVRNAAIIKDFYTIETPEGDKDDCVEQIFNRLGETQAGPIIDEILDKHTFPKEENWAEFIMFLSLMFVRGPWLRQVMTEWVHGRNTQWIDELHSSQQAYQRNPLGQFTYEESLKIYNEIWDTVFPAIKRTAYIGAMLHYARHYYQVFLRMTPNLKYVQTLDDYAFVTSDRPVVPMQAKPGPKPSSLESPNVDVYFPLSSRACLILNWDRLRTASAVGRCRVAYANYVQARNCARLVMSQYQEISWMRENKTISSDPAELIFAFAGQKNRPLVKKHKDNDSHVKCLNDWSILRGRG